MGKLDKSEKFKRVRIVTFKADYAPAGKVIYAKGSVHAIPVDTVEKIKRNGASFDAKKFDLEAETEERKKQFEGDKED